MVRRSIPLRNLLLVILASGGGARLVDAADPDFARDVAPILTKYCTGCHNDSDREGKLSLGSYESLLKGGEGGSIVTPGHADQSRLARLITGTAEPKMPPEGEEAPSLAEIEVLKGWIAAGARGPSGSGTIELVVPQVKLLSEPKLAVHAVALSPDGQTVAVARHGEVEIQALSDGKARNRIRGLRGSVNFVSFSRDGAGLVAAAGEPGLFGEASLFDVRSGRLLKQFRGHKDSMYCAQLSPDGKLLATGSYDNTIKLWDVGSGSETRSLDGHNGAVFELAFRPDGKVLASASGDRTVKLWDVATGERLDTLKESQKELYTLAFSPDGSRLAAAGVDNRIRVWQITPQAKEGTSRLLTTQFAHEMPILRLVWSGDGSTLATGGEDRLVKIWNADTVTIRESLTRQPDWASGLAISGDSDTLVVGRIDGTLSTYSVKANVTSGAGPLQVLPEVPAEVDYGEQPALAALPRVAESEPNDAPEVATGLAAPGMATGIIGASAQHAAGSEEATSDQDLFRFQAVKGDQWIVETKAARDGSPLDTRLEILGSDGQPVPKLLLRAVRDSVIEFRGMNSEQRGVRLANWEEMLLNDYAYISGEVIKLFQQRRGPDADAQFYPENGNRFAYFETTSRAHSLGEPAYLVVPYAVGTVLPENGLPVFTLYFENDDDSRRKLGKDSRLTFVAPADGTYLVRVSDVRGFSGDNFKYELTIRRPQPDFTVALSTPKLDINSGSGKAFTVKADRSDNFDGPIRVEITGLTSEIQVTTSLEIQAGLHEAAGVMLASGEPRELTAEELRGITITATANVCGKERTKKVAPFGSIKISAKPKVAVYLTPAESFSPHEVTITPGGTVTCQLRVERGEFGERIPFDVANLPHGVIVDDIGLSGVLIPEKQTERKIFLRAEPWVLPQERLFFATAQVDGNQSSQPLLLRVERNKP